MKPRIFIFTVFCLAFSLNVFAQTIDKGFYLLRMGQLKGAKEIFTTKIAQNPLDSRSLYGLGEIFFADNNVDSALAYYQRGISANKNDAYNYIGLAKISFVNNNKADAIAKLELAKKAGKKDAVVFAEIAKLLLSQKDRNNAEIDKTITRAKEINSRTADIYLVYAQMSTEKGLASEAANHFESAIYFDSTKFEAFIGYARIMVSAQNTKAALKYLNLLIKKLPDCVVAYRELGEVLFNQGDFENSAKNYEKYISMAEYTPEEKERYAYALFFSQKYDKAREIINELSHGNPDNYIMLRLLAYTHYAQTLANTNATTEDFLKGVELFKRFFNQIPENKILMIDYEYYAKTLISAKLDSLAVIQYQSAYNRDTTRVYLLEEMAKTYSRYRAFNKAAEVYTKLRLRKETPGIMDYYQEGVAYYNAAGIVFTSPADSALKRINFEKADTLFGTVLTRNPKSNSALLMRARTKSQLDPNFKTDAAKELYERTLEIILPTPDKYKREIIEIYKYNAFYFLHKDDYKKSIEFWNKVLEIDPNDAGAKDTRDRIITIMNKS